MEWAVSRAPAPPLHATDAAIHWFSVADRDVSLDGTYAGYAIPAAGRHLSSFCSQSSLHRDRRVAVFSRVLQDQEPRTARHADIRICHRTSDPRSFGKLRYLS